MCALPRASTSRDGFRSSQLFAQIPYRGIARILGREGVASLIAAIGNEEPVVRRTSVGCGLIEVLVLPVIAGLGVEAHPPISQWLELVSLAHGVSSKRDGRDDGAAIELTITLMAGRD